MGRAIVRNPKAFLMDEPLSNLDAKLRVQMRAEIARLQNRLGTTTVYVTHDQTEAMTLGDRVVVMRAGVAQQIGTPEELYDRPANLFVAGFIGSPAMNFFPATLTDVGVSLPFGEVTLTQEVHDVLAQHPKPTNVIVGVRPEHLEDAALIDTYARIRALTFEVTVDLVESLGADKYVHFHTEGAGAHAAQLAELAAESGVGENEFVARVSAESKVTPGQTVELAFDTSKLALFDADTGVNLSIPPAAARCTRRCTREPAAAAPPAAPSEEQPAPSEEQPRRRQSDRRPGRGPRTPARALRPDRDHRRTRRRERDVPRRRVHRRAALRTAMTTSFTMCPLGVRAIR